MALVRTSWIAAAVLGVIALVVVNIVLASICLLGFAPPRDDPARRAALNKYFEGHALYDQGKYTEAAEHYRAWKDYQDAHGADSSEVTGLIGHTLGLAGRDQEARELIDASLATNKRWYVCVYKAHLVARQESEESALAWLKGTELDEVNKARAIASFLRERRQYAAAIPVLEELLDLVGGRRFLVDGAFRVPPTIDTTTHNLTASLLDPLQELADCHLKIKQFEAADQYAQLGVAVGTILHRDATYAGDKYVQAGDVTCRLVKARILMERSEWDAAAKEIEFANAIAEWSSYSGWVRAVQQATEELARRRPKR